LYNESVQTTNASCEQVRERMVNTLKLVNQYSHEINNQLTIIIGRSEQSMLAAREDHLLHSYLDEICNSAQRVADVTRKLLALKA
jgi:signal transduction histidine kinase